MPPRPIVIDTDPGQDDAIAILMALASPELEVLGITAVAGNVPLVRTAENARKVCELAGRPDIVVAAGADRPLLRSLATAERVHGRTGLDGADLPPPKMPLDPRHGAAFLVETLMQRPPGTVTVCAIGPLTNIAHALIREPTIAARIERLVLMGGAAFAGGNVTPTAEFNIGADPEAAKLVFGAGMRTVMVPLDCTHQAVTTARRVAALRALGNRAGTAAAGWLDHSRPFYTHKYGGDGGFLHDPCTIAWLLEPDMFEGREVNVEIETQSELTRGMTVVDWWGVTGRPKNATLLRSVDAERYFAMITRRLGRL